ncbi:hypothetical protein [Edaphobacter flagellatus]|uniref:hypothetical protein n=1 Tax=Edaphobacter flagellatus TaxID=1933044 RepID=UPI0021B168BF|nr:hypothetical protein [Edaphobacter flagellatus]
MTLVLVFSTGCHYRLVKANNNNFPIFVDGDEITQCRNLIAQYRATAPTKEQRNDLQMRLKTISDSHYRTLRDGLNKNRNSLTFGAEVTGATLSAVSALIGDVDTKSILSTASTLVQSTKTSIDNQFFQQQSAAAIIAKMDASRDAEFVIIKTNELQEISGYGLEAALNDSLAYDQVGTIQSALVSLATDAAQQSHTNKLALQSLRLGGHSLEEMSKAVEERVKPAQPDDRLPEVHHPQDTHPPAEGQPAIENIPEPHPQLQPHP